MLPSRLSFPIGTNVFVKTWTAYKRQGFSGTSSRGQILRFNTPRFEQGIEVELDQRRKAVSMFQKIVEYSVQMTNILLRLFNLEIMNKQIIEEKGRSIQNLQGTLEKE